MLDDFKLLDDRNGDAVPHPTLRIPIIASEESKLLCLTRSRGFCRGEEAIIAPRDPFSRQEERGTRGGEADPKGDPQAGRGGGVTIPCLPPPTKFGSLEVDGMGDVEAQWTRFVSREGSCEWFWGRGAGVG